MTRSLLKILWILLLVLTQGASALTLNFQNKDLMVEQVPIADTLYEGVHYVSADLLEYYFKSRGSYDPFTLMFRLEDGRGNTWVLVPEGSFIRIGEEIYHFPYPVKFADHHVFLPTQELLGLMQEKYRARLKFFPADKKIVYEIGTGNILSIYHRVKDNGSLVEIQNTSHLPYEELWVYPHFIINIPGGQLNNDLLLPVEYDQGLVRKISTIQDSTGAQITLYIPGAIDTVTTLANSTANTISAIVRKPDKDKPMTSSAPKKPKTQNRQKTIILDPGHGGKDPGAQFKGIDEKAITLYVARELEKELKNRKYKVMLTREQDTYIELKDRPAFAAKNGGDLFLSLHCNAVGGTPKKQKDVNGFVAYILRAGQSKEDKALARRENQAIKETSQKKNKTEISTVEWILLEHELNLYSHQSEKFAEKIVSRFENGKLAKHRTGAHQAGFFVLVGAFMPAVLFEMGFITNDHDRRFMSTKKGQKDIALRLADSIDDFFAENP